MVQLSKHFSSCFCNTDEINLIFSSNCIGDINTALKNSLLKFNNSTKPNQHFTFNALRFLLNLIEQQTNNLIVPLLTLLFPLPKYLNFSSLELLSFLFGFGCRYLEDKRELI